jgi:AcrR family transcriptional regulator
MPGTSNGRQYRGVSEVERQRERKARLMEAGIRVFGEQGYHAATVKSICNTAGLTERYFYESFTNREQLFRVVYEQLIEQLRSGIIQALSAESRPEELAKLGLTVYFDLLKSDPLLARIVLVESTKVGGEMDEVWRSTTDRFSEVIRQFAPIFLKGAERKVDLDVLAAGLVGGTLNISMAWLYSGYKKPLEKVVEGCYLHFEAVRMYLQEKPDAKKR